MKKIDYGSSNQLKQMGDLLISENVIIKNDFSDIERANLKKFLEDYLTSGSCSLIEIDLKKFTLKIKGSDEAGHLYQIFN